MKLFRKMFGTREAARRIDLQASVEGGGSMSEAGIRVSAETSLSLSAVWGCVNLIAGSISSLPLQVYRGTDEGGREIQRKHPLYRVLHDSPNADQTALDFWDGISMALELWGNAYARIDRLGPTVIGLTPIRPDLVSVRREAGGGLRYRWSASGRMHDLPETGVLHIRGPGGDPLGGMSTLAFGRRSFGLALAAETSASRFFKGGMRPSGVLKFDEWLSAENREIAREYMVKEFVGAENTGKPFVAEGGVSWQPLTMSAEDAQLLETRGFGVEDICRIFGVPPVLVQHHSKTSSWPTGVEQQMLIFQKFTLRRRLKRLEQAMEKQLLSTVERDSGLRIEFNLEGLLRGDSAGRAAFYKSGLNDGWMTINEVRAKENMPPVAGGDVPRIQKQNVPITEIEALIEGGSR